jgi:aromatic-L-amino-acid decarboxylase
MSIKYLLQPELLTKNSSVGLERDIAAENPLILNAAEMDELVATAMQFIAPFQAHADNLPLNGSGYKWLHHGDNNEELDAAQKIAQSVVEPLPEQGTGDLKQLLNQLFWELAPCSMNTLGGGYFGFIPSGGLFHAALADFISLSLNRYVTMSMAAPGIAAIEAQTIRWLCDAIGLPQSAGGVLTSGGSMAALTAIHAARIDKLSHAQDTFLKGTAYVSDQAHYCLEKGLFICGFPQENVRKIPVDDNFRMRLDVLAETIECDRAAGFRPFLVNGTAGTTGTGAVDNLLAIEQIARKYDLWFHVDAAYGGFFTLTKQGKAVLRGIELADSVALDPHKSLFLPYGTGAVLVKDREKLRSAYDFSGTYLPAHREETPLLDEIMYLSPEQTREFRALRIWLPLKMLGVNAFRTQLEEKLTLAQWAAEELSQIPNIRIVTQPQLSILTFKLEPSAQNLQPEELDRLNQEFLDAINQRGNILLSPFRGRQCGEFCLRIAVLSCRTTKAHLQQGLVDISLVAQEIVNKSGEW